MNRAQRRKLAAINRKRKPQNFKVSGTDIEAIKKAYSEFQQVGIKGDTMEIQPIKGDESDASK